MNHFARTLTTLVSLLASGVLPANPAVMGADAAKVVSFFGYDDCIQIENSTTKVVLCPASGGRVLEYSLNGKNALYLDQSEAGFIYKPGERGVMSAGRFDIGPEKIIPPRPQLWMGRWKGEVTGPRSARMTSVKDEPTGVQLTRDFELSEAGSRLTCKQTITNVSKETKEWCHWSRTFALGNGICVIPLSKTSRFPKHYVMYESGNTININPEDDSIRRRGDFLTITDVPRKPKLGMDSTVGWFAYLMKNDLMFVKRFETFPDRVYNEVAGLTISIWYPEDRRVELEPIGPRERLAPGESATFVEHWELAPFPFPDEPGDVDVDEVAKKAYIK